MSQVLDGSYSLPPCAPGVGHAPPVSSPDASVVALPSRDVASTLAGTVPHRPWPFMGAMMRCRARWPPALAASGGMLPWRRFEARLRLSKFTRSDELPANHCGGMVPAGLQQLSAVEFPRACWLTNQPIHICSRFCIRHNTASCANICRVFNYAYLWAGTIYRAGSDWGNSSIGTARNTSRQWLQAVIRRRACFLYATRTRSVMITCQLIGVQL